MKQKIKWNVSLQSVVDNVVQPPTNTPKERGLYLCTCVLWIYGETHKYMRILEWDPEHKTWNRPNQKGIYDVVLAWADIDMCDFDDFIYNIGGYLTPTTEEPISE